MTDEELTDFRNAIHEGLKISPDAESPCFIVEEKDKGSAIEKIKFNFKNENNILIIRLNKMLRIKFLKKFPVTRSCDFIVLMLDKNQDIKIYFCEIKSKHQSLKDACEQIQASKLFFKYLIDCYSTYTQNKCWRNCNIDAATCYYIYPRPNMSAKEKPYQDNDVNSEVNSFLRGNPYKCDSCHIVLHPKPVPVRDDKVVEVLEADIDEFFS